MRNEGTAAVINLMAPKMLGPDTKDPRVAAQVREMMSAAKPAGMADALLGMAERPDSTPFLKAIDMPTLVVAGKADAIIPPAEAEKLTRDIRGAELELISGAGHLVAFEHPDEFNRVLKAWLARVDKSN